MIFVMKPGASEAEIAGVIGLIEKRGLSPHVSKGTELTVIGARGDERALADLPLTVIPGVDRVIPVTKPYRLAARELHPAGSCVKLGRTGIGVGAGKFLMCAGPCTVESRELLLEIARSVRDAGANALRGGAFKPRTSPYSFQGLGEEGLKYLREAGDATGLPVITEVRDLRHVELVGRYADCFQVGARNMQNFDLLLELGRIRKPVLLKRGMSATVKELLMSAEYILAEGNHEVILCERGIRTFETATRGTLDLSAIGVLQIESHLPVMVDPSHAAGRADLVASLTLAAVAAGADGIIVEVHPKPDQAVCDGEQALLPAKFAELMKKIAAVRKAIIA